MLAAGVKRPPFLTTASFVSGISWNPRRIHQPSLSAKKRWSAALSRHPVAFLPSGKFTATITYLNLKCVFQYFLYANYRTKESRVSFYLAPKVVFSLKHLARMAVRRQVVTPDIDQLLLPAPLKIYLKYQDWH